MTPRFTPGTPLPTVGGGDEANDMNDMDADDMPSGNGTPEGHADCVPMDAPAWPGTCPSGGGMGGKY